MKLKTHFLKLSTIYFDDVEKRRKNFEVRYNDRGFFVGDWLVLREWDGKEYTGRECVRQINYICCLDSIGFKDWVGMGIW